MPLYEYRCLKCSSLTEAWRTVERMNDVPECSDCGGETKKIISGYRVHGDLEPYYDDNLETYVRSKQHRQKVMKEKGLFENFGQGWHTSARKRRA